MVVQWSLGLLVLVLCMSRRLQFLHVRRGVPYAPGSGDVGRPYRKKGRRRDGRLAELDRESGHRETYPREPAGYFEPARRRCLDEGAQAARPVEEGGTLRQVARAATAAGGEAAVSRRDVLRGYRGSPGCSHRHGALAAGSCSSGHRCAFSRFDEAGRRESGGILRTGSHGAVERKSRAFAGSLTARLDTCRRFSTITTARSGGQGFCQFGRPGSAVSKPPDRAKPSSHFPHQQPIGADGVGTRRCLTASTRQEWNLNIHVLGRQIGGRWIPSSLGTGTGGRPRLEIHCESGVLAATAGPSGRLAWYLLVRSACWDWARPVPDPVKTCEWNSIVSLLETESCSHGSRVPFGAMRHPPIPGIQLERGRLSGQAGLVSCVESALAPDAGSRWTRVSGAARIASCERHGVCFMASRHRLRRRPGDCARLRVESHRGGRLGCERWWIRLSEEVLDNV